MSSVFIKSYSYELKQ